jgi:aspartate carbamoyltransferase catalytic subunit
MEVVTALENSLKGKDILSLKNMTRKEMDLIFDTADKLDSRKSYDTLHGKIMGALFFETSTRTRLSFEAAMLRLGGGVVGWADASVTRFGDPTRAETFEDTIRMVDDYADVIVMRSPQTGLDYYPYVAADVASIPVINAGFRLPPEDIEHPTQGLLDIFTVKKEKGRIDGLKVAMTGNIRYERTSHARIYGLAKYDVELLFANPEGGGPTEKYLQYIKENKARYRNVSLEEALKEADVCFVVDGGAYKGKKPEQLLEQEKVDALKFGESWRITLDKLKGSKRDMIIMHDLPRSGTGGFAIYPEVDKTPHAAYFREAANGVTVRMALLSLVV